MLDTVLFDLDGTLLPLDQDVFIKTYFRHLAAHMVQMGFEADKAVQGIMVGTGAMLKNNGSRLNCEAFWEATSAFFGKDMKQHEMDFDRFYRGQFAQVREVTYPDARAAECVRRLKEKGYTVVVATSPMFPVIATSKRMEWAGLKADDFVLVTTYDNSTSAKPNPAYYLEILEKIGKKPENCLMVGNDVDEDMCVTSMGMQGFWLDTWPLNRKNLPTDHLERGDFDALLAKIDALPDIR